MCECVCMHAWCNWICIDKCACVHSSASMCMCICTYVYSCVCACMWVCTWMNDGSWVYPWLRVYVYVCTWSCFCVHKCMCVHACAYECLGERVFTGSLHMNTYALVPVTCMGAFRGWYLACDCSVEGSSEKGKFHSSRKRNSRKMRFQNCATKLRKNLKLEIDRQHSNSPFLKIWAKSVSKLWGTLRCMQ